MRSPSLSVSPGGLTARSPSHPNHVCISGWSDSEVTFPVSPGGLTGHLPTPTMSVSPGGLTGHLPTPTMPISPGGLTGHLPTPTMSISPGVLTPVWFSSRYRVHSSKSRVLISCTVSSDAMVTLLLGSHHCLVSTTVMETLLLGSHYCLVSTTAMVTLLLGSHHCLVSTTVMVTVTGQSPLSCQYNGHGNCYWAVTIVLSVQRPW